MTGEEFKQFVIQNQRPLMATIFKLTGNWENSRDLAQEAFVRFWEMRDLFDPRRSLVSLLYRFGINAAIDFLRSSQVRLESNAPDAEYPNLTDGIEDFENKETLQIILHCARKLKDKQRICFILRDVDGLRIEDIAGIINTSPATVRGNLHYARKNIRRMLEENHQFLFGEKNEL